MKNKNQNDKKALKWIFARTKRFIPAIILLSVISAVLSSSGAIVALVSRRVIDTATGDIKGSIYKSGILLFAVIVFQILLNATYSVLKAAVSGKITVSLREYLFSTLVKKKYSNISAYHSGDLLNRFTSDTDVVAGTAISLIPSIVAIFVRIAAGVGALVYLSGGIAIVILVVGVLIPTLGRVISKKFKYLHKESQRTEGETRSFLQECFQNTPLIKSFVSEKPFSKKLDNLMQANYKIKIKRSIISAVIGLGLLSFFSLGYNGVLLWGAGMISKNVITFGTLTALLQLVSQLVSPLQNVSGILPQIYSSTASAERLMELEEFSDEPLPLDEKELEQISKTYESIEINNVEFSYKDEQTLKGLTCFIPRKGITGIVGQSGSGKSTLFKLLLGLYDNFSGTITIGGKPVTASLRGLFAYVPQGNLMLSGTIKENVTLGNEGITAEQIESALKAAEIYDVIKELPDGIETKVTERGGGLSEGQLQRLSIARALVANTPILLFDEATSALDEETETKLLSNIKSMTDKTVIFITHRSVSSAACDRTITIKDGKAVVS